MSGDRGGMPDGPRPKKIRVGTNLEKWDKSRKVGFTLMSAKSNHDLTSILIPVCINIKLQTLPSKSDIG